MFEASQPHMNGVYKVAALMLALYPQDKEFVGRLLKKFSEPEILKITNAASDMGAVTPAILTSVMDEFSVALTSDPGVLGGEDEAQNLLHVALPGQTIDRMNADAADPPDINIWEHFRLFDTPALIAILCEEPPQVAAYILSHLESEQLAQCIEGLAQERTADIISRIVGMGPSSPQAELLISEVFMNVSAAPVERGKTHEAKVIDSLNKMEPEIADTIISKLAEKNPEEAASIRRSMFTFKDIVTLSREARQTLLEKIENDKLIIALKGEASEVQEVFLSLMGGRARKMIEQELNDDRAVQPAKVRTAQKEIANTVVALLRSGTISRE